MVKGIDIFRDFFKDYNSHFILIGGAACHLWADNLGIDFRTTKDLDIVIVVEKLSKDFVKHFWDFVKNGGYSNKQKSINKKNYYRFHSPSNKNYPYMLELFSRKQNRTYRTDKTKHKIVYFRNGEKSSRCKATCKGDGFTSNEI